MEPEITDAQERAFVRFWLGLAILLAVVFGPVLAAALVGH